MGIIISGIDMPTNCTQCPCSDDGARFCRAANEYIPMLGKPNFCPLVETEECKTGKWVQVHGFATPGGDPVWCCSECGKGVHVYGVEHGTYGADISDGQWKACPNCSALMEGEQP